MHNSAAVTAHEKDLSIAAVFLMDSLDSDFYVEVVIKVTRRYITSNLSVLTVHSLGSSVANQREHTLPRHDCPSKVYMLERCD